jgi:hypothetical protein
MWRIVSSLPLGQPRHLHMATSDLSWPTQETDQNQVKDCVVPSFGPTETSSHGNIWLVLAHPRNWSRSSEGLHHRFLLANRDIFVWQHTTCLGPPKELIKIKWCLIVTSFGPTETSSHGNIWLVLARPRNWSPHMKDIVINSFGPSVTFSHGNMWILMVRLRNQLKLPARFISHLLIDFQSPSHTSNNTPFASSWLVLRVVYYMGLAPICHTRFLKTKPNA